MMTRDDLLRAFDACEERLNQGWIRKRPHDHDYVVQGKFVLINDRLRHALWMIHQAREFAAGNPEKAHRWLGFVQGVIWATGLATIEEMKEDNRPQADFVSA